MYNAKETVTKRQIEHSYQLLKDKYDALKINAISYGQPTIVLCNSGEYFIAVDMTYMDTFSEMVGDGQEITLRIFFKC